MTVCNQDVRFGCSVCGAEWGSPCPRTPDEYNPMPGWLAKQIAELRAERDAARFEASRARGEAHVATLALKELQRSRNRERHALERVLMTARDVLKREEPSGD